MSKADDMILNYVYLKWDNILTPYYYIFILITGVAAIEEYFFQVLLDQMQIEASLRHRMGHFKGGEEWERGISKMFHTFLR